MVQANEIRVGNYFMFDSEIDKVTAIYQSGVDAEFKSRWWFDRVHGIPLTTEILLKSGFVFNKQFQRYEVEVSDGVECVKQERLEDDPGAPLYFFYMIGFRSSYIKLDWLHQLQNVHYYISGEELSITL